MELSGCENKGKTTGTWRRTVEREAAVAGRPEELWGLVAGRQDWTLLVEILCSGSDGKNAQVNLTKCSNLNFLFA